MNTKLLSLIHFRVNLVCCTHIHICDQLVVCCNINIILLLMENLYLACSFFFLHMARQVLLDSQLTCKLSDFGMSAALSGGGGGVDNADYSTNYVREYPSIFRLFFDSFYYRQHSCFAFNYQIVPDFSSLSVNPCLENTTARVLLVTHIHSAGGVWGYKSCKYHYTCALSFSHRLSSLYHSHSFLKLLADLSLFLVNVTIQVRLQGGQLPVRWLAIEVCHSVNDQHKLMTRLYEYDLSLVRLVDTMRHVFQVSS